MPVLLLLLTFYQCYGICTEMYTNLKKCTQIIGVQLDEFFTNQLMIYAFIREIIFLKGIIIKGRDCETQNLGSCFPLVG